MGKAAETPPALCVLSHKPDGATKTIAWCGKGIMYDTGQQFLLFLDLLTHLYNFINQISSSCFSNVTATLPVKENAILIKNHRTNHFILETTVKTHEIVECI